MRFRLRTLLIVLAVGPMMLAFIILTVLAFVEPRVDFTAPPAGLKAAAEGKRAKLDIERAASESLPSIP
jgi:hypothetical protein